MLILNNGADYADTVTLTIGLSSQLPNGAILAVYRNNVFIANITQLTFSEALPPGTYTYKVTCSYNGAVQTSANYTVTLLGSNAVTPVPTTPVTPVPTPAPTVPVTTPAPTSSSVLAITYTQAVPSLAGLTGISFPAGYAVSLINTSTDDNTVVLSASNATTGDVIQATITTAQDANIYSKASFTSATGVAIL